MLTIKYFLLSPGFIIIILILISCISSALIGRYKKQLILPSLGLGLLGPIGWLIVWFHKQTEEEIREHETRKKREKFSVADFGLLLMFIFSGILSLGIGQWLNINIERLPKIFVQVILLLSYALYFIGGHGRQMSSREILETGLFSIPFFVLVIISTIIFLRLKSKRVKPKIKSKKDLLLYIKNHIGVGDEIANLICDAIDYGGVRCYIEFKKGGAGNPYHVEYQELSKLDRIPAEDIKARINQLDEMKSRATSDAEKENLQKQIAEASGALVIIWINTVSEGDFNSKSLLIKDAYLRCKNEIEKAL